MGVYLSVAQSSQLPHHFTADLSWITVEGSFVALPALHEHIFLSYFLKTNVAGGRKKKTKKHKGRVKRGRAIPWRARHEENKYLA